MLIDFIDISGLGDLAERITVDSDQIFVSDDLETLKRKAEEAEKAKENGISKD